jgi:hypothetical protein
MSEHRFKIGQTIGFRSYRDARSGPPGRYQIVALRPEQDGEPSYRIKSPLEQHDRIALESELNWIS